MKILVTGATGFIGNHVVLALLQQGHEVIATSVSQEKAINTTWHHNIVYVPFDIDQPNIHLKENQSAFEYFDKPDHLIHLAWQGVSNCEGMFHIEKNLLSHYSFLKGLLENGLKGLTVIGTCLEYGFKTGMQSENQIPEPHVSYAIAKDSLRRFLLELQKHISFSLQWVRLFYMYGDGQHSRSLLAQLHTAIKNGDDMFNMSGGEQERDYLPIEKVAEYLVAIVLNGNKNDVYNCCNGKPTKVKQLVEDEMKKLNASIALNLGFYPYKEYEPMSFWGDNHKLLNLVKN